MPVRVASFFVGGPGDYKVMANPQVEDGHLELANGIVESLARIRISGTEWQVLWVILRKTYGWRKKDDAIPLSQFHEMTALPKPHIIRSLKKLLSKKIIFVIQNDNDFVRYGFNKDFDTWCPLAKKPTTYVPLSKKATEVIKDDSDRYQKRQKTLSKKIPSKEKKDTTKDTITKDKYGTEFHRVLLSPDEFKKITEHFGPRAREKIDALDEYLESSGRRYKSHYATILTWDRRDRKNGTGRPGITGGARAPQSQAPGGRSLGDGAPYPVDYEAEPE